MAGKHRLVGKVLEVAKKMLVDSTNILEENNIKYILEAGTLLGIVRENRLLPWDNDIDITVTEEYEKQ
ncbi:MAG: lipopolysaccharide cholinephosphotransferase, partial [Candidatus Delongbacteria bacterium]